MSFRLTVPHAALEQVADDLADDLPLSIEQDGADLVLKQAEGDCALRFAPVGEELALTEVLICNDEGGAFFSRALARLLTEHQGDLEAKLVWSLQSRNTQGTHATVVFRRGRAVAQAKVATASPANVLRDAVLAGGNPQGELGEVQASGEPASADEEEIRRLLARARDAWAEYQKLKSARGA